jgi:hypothetical protein
VSHTDPEILALRALGEQAGSAQDAAHTAQCADCQRELERLSGVVELARGDGPVQLEQPPAPVWDRIAAAIDADTAQPGVAAAATANGSGPAHLNHDGNPPSAGRPPHPPSTGPGRTPRARRRRSRGKLAVAVAGVAAGLVIGIGATVAITELARPSASPAVAEVALRPLPQYPQWRGAAGTAVLRETPSAQQLAVSVTAPRRVGFYEVWLLGRNGTSMISLGDLDAAKNGTFTLPAGVDLSFYSRIDVSLQPFNGSTLHSSTSVVRGSLPSSAAGAAGG